MPTPYTTVVLDIEGTTTPITFVHDVLFPHVLARLDAFLIESWADDECYEKVDALRIQAEKDVAENVPGAVPVLPATAPADDVRRSVVANVRWQMGIDRKIGPLKALQGYMWRSAYESGEIKGVVYDDVVPALERWTSSLGLDVYIYSSGSVEAQKLLFGWSEKGNLLKYFKGHFDTAIGLKVEPVSYTRIAQEIGREPASILFLSDNVKEIDAALLAGYQAAIAFRPGNAPLPGHPAGSAAPLTIPLGPAEDVQVVETFDQVFERFVAGGAAP
ncbi:2,3-diketo-5-methylthio-1-phosphopentane phosphatase [Blyttiomyces helicus]|uniref:2,3-diketo-5-methylthio-1-phosphopentane phosphatase n=1 Tax=Blyttiomyces helicus TaxID=388810 RepID=A0A4P9WMU4_9FUNG|nr:2,3-diketo-5-methylthio-1-phosphopentane phosphatase [Blyttiomyces helicus]|eukprot:RKO94389.1 2,3-diketo-5-methylthio-1-phosphopentane phosphatase [Blyttiomyces helicus]